MRKEQSRERETSLQPAVHACHPAEGRQAWKRQEIHIDVRGGDGSCHAAPDGASEALHAGDIPGGALQPSLDPGSVAKRVL
jgi:hypothetical protein